MGGGAEGLVWRGCRGEAEGAGTVSCWQTAGKQKLPDFLQRQATSDRLSRGADGNGFARSVQPAQCMHPYAASSGHKQPTHRRRAHRLILAVAVGVVVVGGSASEGEHTHRHRVCQQIAQ